MTDRVLTIHAHWLWCIIHAGKRIENRSWRPPADMIGKRILLHASARKIRDSDLEQLPPHLRPQHNCKQGALQRDTIEGMRRHVCASAVIDRVIEAPEHEVHETWWHGPLGWVLRDVRPTARLEANGSLGLWRLPR